MKKILRQLGDFHCLGVSAWVSSSALTRLVERQEWYPAHKNLCHLSLLVLFRNKWRKKTYGDKWHKLLWDGCPSGPLTNGVRALKETQALTPGQGREYHSPTCLRTFFIRNIFVCVVFVWFVCLFFCVSIMSSIVLWWIKVFITGLLGAGALLHLRQYLSITPTPWKVYPVEFYR